MKDVSSYPHMPRLSELRKENSLKESSESPLAFLPRLAAAILSWLFYKDLDTGFLSGFRNRFRNTVVHDFVDAGHCDWCYDDWTVAPYFGDYTDSGTSGGNPDADEASVQQPAGGSDAGDSSPDESAAE